MYFAIGIFIALLLFLSTALFIIAPIVFKYSHTFQRNVVFLTAVCFPRNVSFKNPNKHGLHSTRNFSIQTDDKIKLGAWHVLPENLAKHDLAEEDEEEYYEKSLSYGNPVFIYMHGNWSNRAGAHHIKLHQILRKHSHVITFDYRGYGDSEGIPWTESLVIRDAMAVVKWVKRLTSVKIFVWGHSIGSGISTHALRLLAEEGVQVDGLILQGPFDNFRNQIAKYPPTLIYRDLPWFKYTVQDPLHKNGFIFKSDEHIKYVDCLIMIVHAEDDFIVPIGLGLQLYSAAIKHRTEKQGPVCLKVFPTKLGYGHKHVYKAPDLPDLIENFMKACCKVPRINNNN